MYMHNSKQRSILQWVCQHLWLVEPKDGSEISNLVHLMHGILREPKKGKNTRIFLFMECKVFFNPS